MEYFRLMQNRRYSGSVFFNVASLFLPKDNLACNYRHLEHLTTRRVKNSQFNFYPDVLDQQMYLISDCMNDLLSLFMPEIEYKILCTLDYEQRIYNYFYAHLFDPLDCISEKSETSLDRSKISKLVLRKDAINGHDVFKVGGVKCHTVVVSLPVAEAVSRRNFTGIQLVKTELN